MGDDEEITILPGGDAMKKKWIIFLSVIVLHICFLSKLSIGECTKVSNDTGKMLSIQGSGQETKETNLEDLPVGVREKISHHLLQAEYKISHNKEELSSGKSSLYRAYNRKQNLAVYFTEQGIDLLPGRRGKPAWHLEMTLSSWGYPDAMEPIKVLGKDAVKASGGRIEYQREVLTEWYVNTNQGLEQGLTLNRPPAGKTVGRLTVEWTVATPLKPIVEEEGAAVVFCGAGGEPVLRYSGLKTWDATGRFLPVKLELKSNGMEKSSYRIAYLLDDTGASYPVMIDPVFTQVKKLLPSNPSDGMERDYFGYSVSIDGDTAVVGAHLDDSNGTNSGSAYIFHRNQGGVGNWGNVKKISASDSVARDTFGISVSIDGDTVVVGAYSNDGSGSAYIFYRNQGGTNYWGEVKKITASDGAEDDFFGYSVSIEGDMLIVGAHGDDDNGSGSGSAYIFNRNQGGVDNWGEAKKITASDGTANDSFGTSVAISGPTVVVGAVGYDVFGSAYIFARNQGGTDNWGHVTTLTASDGAWGDRFGISVAISGETVVVGADREDDNGTESGAAYIFHRNQGGANNWGQVTKISANDGAAGNYFGYRVAIRSLWLVVGAYGRADSGAHSGAAYIFYRHQGGNNNWGQYTKITASDGKADDYFGYSVSIDGDTAVVGAYKVDDNGDDSGAAYIFDRNQVGGNWEQTIKIIPEESGDRFGWSVSVSGDTAVVGAPGKKDNGANSGTAYIFYRNLGGGDYWGEDRKITASDGAAGDYFGYSVSLDGDTLIVGAYGDDDNGSASGSAYIFYRNQGGGDYWGELKKIIASDGTATNLFGSSVSISGNTVVVGAWFDDDYGYASGSAYIFYRDQGGSNNWGEVTKLNGFALNGYFGYSVSIDGDTVVVGAYGSGSASIFYRNQGGTDNWGQVTTVTASDGAAGDSFGLSVSIDGDTVVVGATGDDDNGSASGSAYIFNRNQGGVDNWGEVKKIIANDSAEEDLFGISVAISGPAVVVGAYRDDDNGTDSGSSYIFYRDQGGINNWGQVAKITASDGAAGEWFGNSVSNDGNIIVVGASRDDDNGKDSGSTYIFKYFYQSAANPGILFLLFDH
jgi:hypothetical protein